MSTNNDAGPRGSNLTTDVEGASGLFLFDGDYGCDECEDTRLVGDQGPGGYNGINEEWTTCDCRRQPTSERRQALKEVQAAVAWLEGKRDRETCRIITRCSRPPEKILVDAIKPLLPNVEESGDSQ